MLKSVLCKVFSAYINQLCGAIGSIFPPNLLPITAMQTVIYKNVIFYKYYMYNILGHGKPTFSKLDFKFNR